MSEIQVVAGHSVPRNNLNFGAECDEESWHVNQALYLDQLRCWPSGILHFVQDDSRRLWMTYERS